LNKNIIELMKELNTIEKQIRAQKKKSEEYDRINSELYLRFLDEEIGAENVVEAEYDW